jgi:predicted Holliday junction resolvase-like endonuclease
MGTISTIVIVVLLLVAVVLGFILAYFYTRFTFEIKLGKFKQEKQAEIERARKEAITQSRGVLGGKFTEQVMPYLPDFKYDPTEARFIGSPIDFIIFPGLAAGEPREIVIVEVKSGKNPRLTASEAKIRELIENGMVRWELIQRPADNGG